MAAKERKRHNGILSRRSSGRVSPLRAAFQAPARGAHGVTRPTFVCQNLI